VSSWRKAVFKGKEVWVQVDADGEPRVSGGRVPIRYSDREGAKVYRAGAGNVSLGDAPALTLPDGVAADAPAPTRATRSAPLPEPGSLAVFTDGACKGNPGPAGAGVYIQGLPKGEVRAARALGRATNNIAELTAIGVAVDLLDAAGIPADAEVPLFSDSSYALGLLTKGWKAKANQELAAELRRKVATRPGLMLRWVKGHAGHAGNEEADRLANLGVDGEDFVEGL